MSKYTTILYEVKKNLKLSFSEYIFLDIIYHLQVVNGYAYAKSDFYCEKLGVTQRQLSRIKTSLINAGLIEVIDGSNSVKLKLTKKFIEALNGKEEKKDNDEDPFTLEEYLASMRASPQKHIQIIAEYADEKKPDYKTKGQWRAFTNRNLKVARQLSEFSMDQITDAFEKMLKDVRSEGNKNPKAFITKWTLETVLKYIIE